MTTTDLSFLSLRYRCLPPSGAFLPPNHLPPIALLAALSALTSAALAAKTRYNGRNRRSLTRHIQTLKALFDFLLQSPPPIISPTALLCFRELYILIYRAKNLIEYCAQSSRIWLVIKSPQICSYFHDIGQELATVLDVLPLDELCLCGDVREHVELLGRQCRQSDIHIDSAEESIRRNICSFLSEFELGQVPESSELGRIFVDELGIRDARGCRKEIELLEEQIVDSEEDAYLPILGGVVALARYCRFLLFGFADRCFDRLVGFGLDSELEEKMMGLSSFGSGGCSVMVPKDFCCPITLDLMKDPVVVSTGQTYDRASITQWIEEGHRSCPNSGQILVSSRLVPNRALRSVIFQWCAANQIPYDANESFIASIDCVYALSSSKAAIEANRATSKLLIKELVYGSDDAKTIAARELRLLAKTGKENRAIIAELGAIPLLCCLFLSSNWIAQENAVTAILNLSIHDDNKGRIVEEEGCLKQIVHVLKHGITAETRENAAATLFSLSAVHKFKIRIVDEQGAVADLANLLMQGSPRGKKDAVMALFNLSTHPDSWCSMLDFGAVSALVAALRDEIVAEEAVGALALLVKQPIVAEVVGNEDTALTNLVGLMRRGTPKGKENVVAALQEMCRRGGLPVTQRVARMPALGSLIQNILFTGTKRARRKAALLTKICQRSASSMASNTTVSDGWAIDHALSMTTSMNSSSFHSGEVSSMPMVPVL